MTLTYSMIQKLSEPGLWFIKSNQPRNDIRNLVNELTVKIGVPISVNTTCKKEIQEYVIAKVMRDCIISASDENEKNWLEQEMSEYNVHGFFSYPEHMNDYVENGPFWEEYVHFNDDLPLQIHNYVDRIIVYEDIHTLEYDEETVFLKILQLNHEEALRLNRTVIVLVTKELVESAKEFIENHLF